MEAAKDQGLWPVMTGAEETEWLTGFAEWSRESVDGPDRLEVIQIDRVPIGRLRTQRDTIAVDGHQVPRVSLCGLQLRPAYQRRGIGTAIIATLKTEVTEAGGVLDLGVEHTNSSARRLYDRLDFVPIGRDDDEVMMRWTP